MADLPPDIMSMLSRGNLPDEDDFEDFMEQASYALAIRLQPHDIDAHYIKPLLDSCRLYLLI